MLKYLTGRLDFTLGRVSTIQCHLDWTRHSSSRMLMLFRKGEDFAVENLKVVCDKCG